MDLRDQDARLTGIYEALKAAKASGMDESDPKRFAFMAESYWTLRRMIADAE
jgi:hypothetical protein